MQTPLPPSHHHSDQATAESILYVFGCTAEGCGVQAGSWRAWSLPLPASATQQSQPMEQPVPVAAPAADWGMDSSDWGCEAAALSVSQEDISLSELQAGFDSLLLHAPGSQEQARVPFQHAH
jgi:hypothetical protein